MISPDEMSDIALTSWLQDKSPLRIRVQNGPPISLLTERYFLTALHDSGCAFTAAEGEHGGQILSVDLAGEGSMAAAVPPDSPGKVVVVIVSGSLTVIVTGPNPMASEF